MNQIRLQIEQELTARGIKYSTQAVNALYEATIHSSPETVGDSDSLLMGLVQCGSYTIDALVDSGVDTNYLFNIASTSVSYESEHHPNPLNMLFSDYGVFGNFLNNYNNESRILETSDILEIAVTPETLEGSYDCWFPKELCNTPSPTSTSLLEIENQVCQLIELCVETISQKPESTLSKRKKPLSQNETNKIIEELYYVYEPDALWAITLTNKWLTERTLYLDNYQQTLDIYNNVYGGLRFGSSMFMESGGDFSELNIALKIAKRYAPEREDPILGLAERDGRIYVKPFSYRNTTRLNGDKPSEILSIGAEVILPLATANSICEFEDIINKNNVKENTIQKFLEYHPEILSSLGNYASCKPHVILREKGKTDLIPDFILQRPGNNGFDILDLKLPNVKVSVQKPYMRVSYEISKAVAQLRAYKNYFKNPSNMSTFHKKYGIEALSPELIVVIGRSSEFNDIYERKELNKLASGIKIISYDELIDYGKARSLTMTNAR